MASRNRGKPKPKLRDYSHLPLSSEEKSALLDAAGANVNPISTAVLGAVMVEHELEGLLRKKMRRRDQATWDKLVDGEGPLKSFYSKTLLAYALSILTIKLKSDLDIIRTIRNTFAHSKRVLTFGDPLIVKELIGANHLDSRMKKGLREIKPHHPELGQTAFVSLCYSVTIELMQKQSRYTIAANKRLERKFNKSPFASAFAQLLAQGAQQSGPEGTPQQNALYQSAHPKPPLPPPFGLAALAGFGAGLPRKPDTDKE